MNSAVADVSGLKEGIPGQLTLVIKAPLLEVGCDTTLLWIECADSRVDTESGIKGSRGRSGKRRRIPVAVARGNTARAVGIEGALQKVAVAGSNLACAVLVGSAIEKGKAVAALEDLLLRELVREAEAWAEVFIVDVSARDTLRTRVELCGDAREISGGGIRIGLVEEHDLISLFDEGQHDVPAQAGVDGELGVDLDVVLDVGGEEEIAQAELVGEDAVRTIDLAEKEAGKGAAGGA